MIAVFAMSENQFRNEIRFSTPGTLKFIRSTQDVRGRTFTGVIVMAGALSDESWEAHEVLKERQPELFKRNKK